MTKVIRATKRWARGDRAAFVDNFEVDGVRKVGGNCSARAVTLPAVPWNG